MPNLYEFCFDDMTIGDSAMLVALGNLAVLGELKPENVFTLLGIAQQFCNVEVGLLPIDEMSNFVHQFIGAVNEHFKEVANNAAHN